LQGVQIFVSVLISCHFLALTFITAQPSKTFEEQLKLYNEKPDPVQAANLMKEAKRQRMDIKVSEQIFQSLVTNASTPPTQEMFLSLISTYCERKQIEQAYKCFTVMTEKYNLKPTPSLFRSLMWCCYHTRATNRAVAIFRTMELKYPDLSASPGALGFPIRLFLESGLIEDAVRVIYFMDKRGTVPAAVTYRDILKYCTVARDMKMAEFAQEHLKKTKVNDRVVNNQLLNMFAKFGNEEAALSIFTKSQDDVVGMYLYNEIYVVLPMFSMVNYDEFVQSYGQANTCTRII
jgi:pentatricopeptide repeat protein